MRLHTTQFKYEFIPAQKRTKSPHLMVVLHGRGDSLKPFRYLGEELGLPEMNFLLLNAPRQYLGGYTWYAFPPHQARGVLDARARLNILMDELEEQGVPSSKVFFFGFSQGSLVSCDFGMQMKKPLAGIIGISGYLYFFKGWRKALTRAAFKTPWFITHGLRDEALDIDETREQVGELIEAGLPVQWLEFNKDHEIDEKREIPLIRRFVRNQIKYSSKAGRRSNELELSL